QQLLPAEDLRQVRIVLGDDALHHAALAVDDGGDLLFQGAFGDQLDHLHGPLLADAVDAVRRLVLPSGVPPAVVVNDHRAGHQVDPRSSRLEAPQEDPALRILVEAVDEGTAIDASSREGDVLHSNLAKMALHQFDHAQELREHHDFLAAAEGLPEDLPEEVPLARSVAVRLVELAQGQGGVIADLLEEVEQRENVDVG